jgi:hypothetical protein
MKSGIAMGAVFGVLGSILAFACWLSIQVLHAQDVEAKPTVAVMLTTEETLKLENLHLKSQIINLQAQLADANYKLAQSGWNSEMDTLIKKVGQDHKITGVELDPKTFTLRARQPEQ